MLPQPVQFNGLDVRADRPPPPLGRDTRAVLLECGYSEADIDHFVASGAAAVATA